MTARNTWNERRSQGLCGDCGRHKSSATRCEQCVIKLAQRRVGRHRIAGTKVPNPAAPKRGQIDAIGTCAARDYRPGDMLKSSRWSDPRMLYLLRPSMGCVVLRDVHGYTSEFERLPADVEKAS